MHSQMTGYMNETPWGLYNRNTNDYTNHILARQSLQLQWNTTLSFTSLKDAGLVSCFNEYRSIKVAFYHKKPNAKFIIKWLKNQKQNFRISYLSHILMDGYAKECLKHTIAIDIENIIMSYCNIIFIKFYDNGSSNKYKLRVFDANFSINNLKAILESENGDNTTRIWSHFNAIKWIYSDAENTNENIYNIDYDNNKNDNRWVQIPNNKCTDLTISEIDSKLPYHKILEFGVDKMNKACFAIDGNINCVRWTFMETIPKICNVENRLDWLCSLSKGDIIDVFYGMKWNEAYITERDYDTFYLCFINDYSGNVYKIKSIGFDLNRLQRRYTHCEYFANPFCNNKYYNNTHKFNKLVNCAWITAFAGNAMYYPILIE
eukprot:451224_1